MNDNKENKEEFQNILNNLEIMEQEQDIERLQNYEDYVASDDLLNNYIEEFNQIELNNNNNNNNNNDTIDKYCDTFMDTISSEIGIYFIYILLKLILIILKIKNRIMSRFKYERI